MPESAPGGVYLVPGGYLVQRGVCSWGVYLIRGCLLPGGCLLLGGVSAPRGVSAVGLSAPKGVFAPTGVGVCSWGGVCLSMLRYCTPPCEQNDKQVQKSLRLAPTSLRLVIKVMCWSKWNISWQKTLDRSRIFQEGEGANLRQGALID